MFETLFIILGASLGIYIGLLVMEHAPIWIQLIVMVVCLLLLSGMLAHGDTVDIEGRTWVLCKVSQGEAKGGAYPTLFRVDHEREEVFVVYSNGFLLSEERKSQIRTLHKIPKAACKVVRGDS